MGPRDYAEIASLIQNALSSLVSKVDRLDEKVDLISQNHASRTDLEKLRRDIQASYVPRDAYEARHAALIARDAQIETDLKQLATEAQADFQRVHERLESGKQQIEDRLKDAQSLQLSDQDRRWMRWTQVFSIAAVLITLLGLLLQHVRFS